MRRSKRHRDREPGERRLGTHGSGRRDFLLASATAGLSVALPLAALAEPSRPGSAAPSDPPRVRARRTLGQTGVEIPDISFGAFSLDGDERLVRTALDSGITHFDTAESYMQGRSEETLGRALVGRRDQVTLTSKVVAAPNASAHELMQGLERSLERLQTDRVDFYLNHAVNSLERVQSSEWAEFVARARDAGKLRFSGMSGHGPQLVRCLEAALETSWLDVILVAYNYVQTPSFLNSAYLGIQRLLGRIDWVAQQPELPDFLLRARRAGVGIMVMKTLRGANLNEIRPYESTLGSGTSTFAQAALRWVLSDERVDGAVISMKSTSAIDEYLVASGAERVGPDDIGLLYRYESRNRATQCIQGCSGPCESACPNIVPIAEVLRFGMYDRDYGLPEIAKREYASLERDASACLDCKTSACLSACPTGVEIDRLARLTDRRLRPG